MILTYRQDDILLIKLPLKLPLIRFFLSHWETDGLSTDLILINLVSTISNLHQPILYKTRIIINKGYINIYYLATSNSSDLEFNKNITQKYAVKELETAALLFHTNGVLVL